MQRSRLMTVRALRVGLLVGPFLLLGCGGGTEKGATIAVSGKVTLDGSPFSEASIRFTSPQSGASFPVDLGHDGTYTLELLDTHEGEAYGVSFGPILKPADKVELDGAGVPKPNPLPPIPKKYLEHTSSGLTAKIGKESKQTFDFELQGQP